MKKLISLLLLLMSINTMNAQLLKFGLKAGANFSNLEGDDIDGSTYTSFHFGAVVEFKVAGIFAIQPEVLYSSQGTKINSDAFQDINYNYITVPVMAKFYIIPTKLSLDVGPQFAFLVNEDVADQFEGETFDFGIAGGLGLDVTKSLFLQARYVVGLTEASTNADVTNRVAQLSIGYKF
jgi:hypothetical protein